MTELAVFTLADGSTILVEAPESPTFSVDVESDQSGPVVVRGWRDRPQEPAGMVTVAASKTFEQAIETIEPAATALAKQLRALPDAPDEITVEFGVQMSAGAGAYIAQVAAAANFKISLVWRRAPEFPL